MKASILYSAMLVLLFSACTTAFKTGQTPDDVYYSPAPEVIEYSGSRNSYANPDDQYLRMKVRNQYRWGLIDDFTYWNMPYNYYGYMPFNYTYNYWFYPGIHQTYWLNNYYNNWGFAYGNYYLPYYYPSFIIKNPVKSAATNRPRLGGYSNYVFNNNNNNNSKNSKNNLFRNNNTYNNTNRTINNNEPAPFRTYSPIINSGSRGVGGSGSGGGISRPSRN